VTRQFIKPYKSQTSVHETFNARELFKQLKPGHHYIEPKIDGMSLMCEVEDGVIQLYSADKLELSSKFPVITSSIKENLEPNVTLVGELIVLDDKGKALPHEEIVGISHTLGRYEGDRVRFIVYDVIQLAGQDLRSYSLQMRREILNPLLREQPAFIDQISYERFDAQGDISDFHNLVQYLTTEEGVIIKHVDSTYDSLGSKDHWKLKWRYDLDLMVLGKRLVKGSTCTFNYQLGFLGNDNKITLCGKSMNSNVQAESGDIISCHVERVKRYGPSKFGVYLARVQSKRDDKILPDPESLLEIQSRGIRES
jgi:ATP-dependent DNA ligase